MPQHSSLENNWVSPSLIVPRSMLASRCLTLSIQHAVFTQLESYSFLLHERNLLVLFFLQVLYQLFSMTSCLSICTQECYSSLDHHWVSHSRDKSSKAQGVIAPSVHHIVRERPKSSPISTPGRLYQRLRKQGTENWMELVRQILSWFNDAQRLISHR